MHIIYIVQYHRSNTFWLTTCQIWMDNQDDLCDQLGMYCKHRITIWITMLMNIWATWLPLHHGALKRAQNYTNTQKAQSRHNVTLPVDEQRPVHKNTETKMAAFNCYLIILLPLSPVYLPFLFSFFKPAINCVDIGLICQHTGLKVAGLTGGPTGQRERYILSIAIRGRSSLEP